MKNAKRRRVAWCIERSGHLFLSYMADTRREAVAKWVSDDWSWQRWKKHDPTVRAVKVEVRRV